jgi:hypothetical protein
MDGRCGSSNRTPALQERSPAIKPQSKTTGLFEGRNQRGRGRAKGQEGGVLNRIMKSVKNYFKGGGV